MRIAIQLAALAAIAGMSTACVLRPPGQMAGMATSPQRTLAGPVAGYKTAVVPVVGALYGNVRAPMTASASGQPFGPRSGTAVAHAISLPPLPFPGMTTGIPLFSWGDASEKAAADHGAIADISHADYGAMTVLMFYRRFETVVYGN